MKSFMRLGAYAALLLIPLVCAGPARAQNAPPPPAGYDVLKMEAGTWDGDLAVPDANGKIQHYPAVQRNSLIAEGTWMLNDLFMPGAKKGSPRYHGHGVWSYDPARKVYAGTWVDQNFATMRQDSGVYDPATSTLYWTSDQPDNKGHIGHFRFVEQFLGDKRIFTMYVLNAKTGKEILCGTITFTRRPGVDPAKNEDDTSSLP